MFIQQAADHLSSHSLQKLSNQVNQKTVKLSCQSIGEPRTVKYTTYPIICSHFRELKLLQVDHQFFKYSEIDTNPIKFSRKTFAILTAKLPQSKVCYISKEPKKRLKVPNNINFNFLR